MKDQKIYALLFSLLFAPLVWGAGSNASHWTFDPAEYAYDMNVHAALMFNGMDVEDYAAFKVAAFCGNECRGIAKATVSQGKKYYELRVYSKKPQADNITFKCYNQATGRELMVAESLLFDGEQHGTLSRLFQLTATQPVTGIRLDKTAVTLNTTDTYTLVANVDPIDASNKSVTWNSSDAAIATVDDNGVVTGIKAGTATITVTTVDGDFAATCTVTVLQPVTGISLDKTSVTLNTTDTYSLIANVNPTDASNKSVTWNSSDAAIATVDDNGVVTGIKVGTATITVTTVDGNFTATCAVTILQPVTGVHLDKTAVTLNTTDTYTLVATVDPIDASNKSVTWNSSDAAIATVDDNGVVTGIKAGTATITVTTVDGDFAATCAVTVLQPVTGISLDKTSVTLNTTETYTLVATVDPVDASNKSVTWNSSDAAIATVDDNGVVTGIKAGTATITVTTVDGDFAATCAVTVLQPVTGISLDKTSVTLNTTETYTLVATVDPVDASNKSVTWSSSDAAIATVDDKGVLTGIKVGTATITVTTVDGDFTATCAVTVLQPVTGVSLDKTSVTLNTTDTYTLIVNVDPIDASNKSVTWSSSDAAIATVDEKGVVTGIKAGTATITVTTVDGDFTATCAVTVLQPVTGVRLDKTEVTLNIAESTVLQATVLPADASNQTVEWSSSNDDIATIDNGGKITAVAIGNAIITVTTTDGSHTATCQVIVKPILVASVKITCEEDQLLLTPNQQTLHFSASVLPENATDKDLVWSIESGDDLATITQNGVLQAIDGVKKDGEVVVRATAVDQSNAYDEVTVSFQGFATGIQSFDQQAIFISSPVADRLYIRGDFDRLKHISIIDSSGRICIQVEQLLSGESIDVSPLSRGIYYVMMERNMNRILHKFIKME